MALIHSVGGRNIENGDLRPLPCAATTNKKSNKQSGKTLISYGGFPPSFEQKKNASRTKTWCQLERSSLQIFRNKLCAARQL